MNFLLLIYLRIFTYLASSRCYHVSMHSCCSRVSTKSAARSIHPDNFRTSLFIASCSLHSTAWWAMPDANSCLVRFKGPSLTILSQAQLYCFLRQKMRSRNKVEIDILLNLEEIFHSLHIRYLHHKHIGLFPLCNREEHCLLFVPVLEVCGRKIRRCLENM